MKKSPVIVLFLFLILNFCAFSQSESSENPEGMTGETARANTGEHPETVMNESIIRRMGDVLGLTLEELIDSQGLPDDFYPLRGPTPGQDSVVFHYSDSYTYYLADGHVWQVRADRDDLFQGDELSLGIPLRDVKALMGVPQRSGEDYSIYSLDRIGFPVAAAFYFEDGLSDLYVYRSDF